MGDFIATKSYNRLFDGKIKENNILNVDDIDGARPKKSIRERKAQIEPFLEKPQSNIRAINKGGYSNDVRDSLDTFKEMNQANQEYAQKDDSLRNAWQKFYAVTPNENRERIYRKIDMQNLAQQSQPKIVSNPPRSGNVDVRVMNDPAFVANYKRFHGEDCREEKSFGQNYVAFFGVDGNPKSTMGRQRNLRYEQIAQSIENSKFSGSQQQNYRYYQPPPQPAPQSRVDYSNDYEFKMNEYKFWGNAENNKKSREMPQNTSTSQIRNSRRQNFLFQEKKFLQTRRPFKVIDNNYMKKR